MTPHERRQLIVTLLSTTLPLTLTEDGPYLWAVKDPQPSIRQLVTFANALVDEMLAQERV